MRILIKGGVWKNTEDEILKAAVMKYGKNQWARISSLLTRKTPKQCKARWFEWLDPSIKKTEWSKEEDEKLLHLAKLMPTQWRTIAPIVGRTPSQCLERYQFLLEEAEAKDGADDDAGPNADDIRRLRPGEIDPEPESKPARPDPVDMDEDEKEMLSEARARLANTQGKKAKRKAREKQLEEARRLASLQKRRELKAAGIETGMKPKKKRGMDYNADIPFQKRAPVGFFDVAEEKGREAKEKDKGVGQLLSKLEGKRRSEVEEEERRKDVKKQKIHKESGDLAPTKQMREAEEAAKYQTSARRSLVLPIPQVGDAEIEELVKLKSREENAKAAIDSDADPSAATNALLSEYKASVMAAPVGRTPLRTPATPTSDSLRVQARNLRAMQEMQTPLLGETVEFEGDEAYTYTGSTPRSTVVATPNPLAAQLTPRAGGAGAGATPHAGTGPSATPRDEMGINTPLRSDGGFDETPRQRQSVMKQQLSSLFKTLPKPTNDFKVVIPSARKPREDDVDDAAVSTGVDKVQDMEDVARAQQAFVNAATRERDLLRSTPLQRGLPRPLLYLPDAFEPTAEENAADRLVREEMERLILHDMAHHPQPGQIPVPKSLAKEGGAGLTLDALTQATALIAEEVAKVRGSLERDLTILHARAAAVEEEDRVFLLPTAPGALGRFAKRDETSVAERVANHARQLEVAREAMKRHHAAATKMEKKLNVVCGGYMARNTKLRRDFAEVLGELEEGAASLESFRLCRKMEEGAVVERVEGLKEEVRILERRERELQEKYRGLVEKKEALLSERGV
ncbi:pre-mRNA splicing factor component-domain-containing protein [Chytriomyces sp. MP71]|nr:pre-mRNA splicing factor component-domain-containing protein [Chytriomyces sp. MP71]